MWRQIYNTYIICVSQMKCIQDCADFAKRSCWIHSGHIMGRFEELGKIFRCVPSNVMLSSRLVIFLLFFETIQGFSRLKPNTRVKLHVCGVTITNSTFPVSPLLQSLECISFSFHFALLSPAGSAQLHAHHMHCVVSGCDSDIWVTTRYNTA